MRTGSSYDALAELVSPAAQTESRYMLPMKPSEFKSIVEDFNFFEVGEIVFLDGKYDFIIRTDNREKGFVYIWVEQFESSYSIVYVGKAGKTLRARFGQHKSGFNGGSVTGKKNAVFIDKGLSEKKRYIIYARKSPSIEILGEHVPSESIEEIALIKKLNLNLWNRI